MPAHGPKLRDLVYFLAGFCVIAAICGTLVASGGSIVVTAHDQLDGEVVMYFAHARHPFSDTIPELLGGVPSSDVVMASPGSLVFYLCLSPLGAFVANWCFVLVVAYSGMFVCLRDLGVSLGVCLCFALLFALVPFYPVYGLTVMGVPLVLLAVRLATRGNMCPAVALTVFYGVFSSPFTCGYAVLACIFLFALACLVKGRRRGALRAAGVGGALVAAYAVAHGYVLVGLLGGGAVSQRVETVLSSTPFSWDSAVSLFSEGKVAGSPVFYHVEANQRNVVLLSAAALVVGVGATAGWRLAKPDAGPAPWEPQLSWVAGLLALAFAIAVFYCAFHTQAAVGLRMRLPGFLGSFQFDRFYWLYPAIWYICAAMSSELLLRIAADSPLPRLAASVAVAVAVSSTLMVDLGSSDALLTARSATSGAAPPASKVTWNGFFAADAMEEAREAIGEDAGSYRVASIGMHPSVAAMGGFSCLDGYLSSYPLEYKHRFREVIAGELECDEAMRKYFDEWGNRCYLFQHEVGRNYMVGKGSGAEIGDLRVDLGAFAEMGGRYILSAVPIADCSSYGLEEVCVCDDAAALYRVHVYGLASGAAPGQEEG